MATPAIETIVKMLEFQPEEIQSQAAEYLQRWLAELEDEAHWNEDFARSQMGLYESAREARKQIAENKAEPMDFDRL
ncbi:MAG: hypothetical protein JETCAE02_08410 [Anaerolineaceae bacterium]|nr:hypothetical protein [Anaerolineae bacterium]MBL1171892.1 hypothetical protein [Chloroflexota bacterium]MDL1925873.1 hypothetical protein [Anaerolineae bacterium AMX1]WKZ53277.1 MAG: hypothetical protein QY324_10630 [Anaerolineales bacterium]GJQ38429.1 MAG: hypothetical protein JETCAE02_08410 [Anaerolineaceae bacterium]